jgi:hypothetical protein
MSYDLNNADQQKNGDLISDGTFARVTMIIRPGGIDGDGEFDRGLLRRAKDPNSDVRMIDAELTVVQGPYARRKLWQMFTVQGGKSDENGVSIAGKISQSTFRAMIDSALGLDPQDMSEVRGVAQRKRMENCDGRQGCAGEPKPLARDHGQNHCPATGMVKGRASNRTAAATAASCPRSRLVAVAGRHSPIGKQAGRARLAQG